MKNKKIIFAKNINLKVSSIHNIIIYKYIFKGNLNSKYCHEIQTRIQTFYKFYISLNSPQRMYFILFFLRSNDQSLN
jgi:hypothetical protein